jgi:hypothetical protein
VWQQIGFQGRDPATDFRGMGMLGLDHLAYLCTAHEALAREMSHASRSGYEVCYPFFCFFFVSKLSYVVAHTPRPPPHSIRLRLPASISRRSCCVCSSPGASTTSFSDPTASPFSFLSGTWRWTGPCIWGVVFFLCADGIVMHFFFFFFGIVSIPVSATCTSGSLRSFTGAGTRPGRSTLWRSTRFCARSNPMSARAPSSCRTRRRSVSRYLEQKGLKLKK